MSQTERLYKIRHLLALGKCLGKQRLLDELGVSPATLKRDLAHLRYARLRSATPCCAPAPNTAKAASTATATARSTAKNNTPVPARYRHPPAIPRFTTRCKSKIVRSQSPRSTSQLPRVNLVSPYFSGFRRPFTTARPCSTCSRGAKPNSSNAWRAAQYCALATPSGCPTSRLH